MNRILNKLPIGLKLGGSFVVIVVILAASLILSYYDMSQLNDGMMSLYFDRTIPIQDLGEAKALLGQIKSNLQLYLQIPQPKNNTADSKDTPQCGSCHIAQVSGTHYIQNEQPASDTTRCLACHAKQAGDAQHGRSTTNITSGQDCASCHPAEVILLQHSQVEKVITDEVVRVNEIISAYRKNALLTAEEKKELASFDTAWNNYQNIVADLLLKASNSQSQDALHRIVGGDALTSQREVEESINRLVAVNQKLAQQSQEKSVQTFNASTLRLFIAGILGIFLAAGLGFVITPNILTPIEAIAQGLQNLRQGNLSWDVPQQVRENIIQRSDEMGIAGKGFDSTVHYLQEMAGVANQIASGDLTVKVTTQGEQDKLGIAFSQMIASLRTLIIMVTENADNLTRAAEQLTATSSQSDEATRQIATTIQQVALGIAQQTAGVTKTSASVEQMSHAMEGIAKGAHEQAKAISTASQIASRINTAIEQVTSNAQAVTRDSAQAASYSRDGAKTVKETIIGMEAIRSKVGLSAIKVEEMGIRSEEIGVIVETIEDIASQTNLLALNAAIEAARAEGSGKQANEKLAQTHLVSVAKMLAEMLCRNSTSLKSEDLSEIAQRLNVEILSITDADGVIITSSQLDAVGFRIPDNGKGQAAAFRPLLGQDDGVVVQPVMARDDNGRLYLFVGISRRDQPGLIQVGMPAQSLFQFGDISRGFAVVADEVRKLAGRSSLATREIAALIKGIQKTVREAVTAMQASAAEVETGVTHASSSGIVLDNILEAAESVYKQAEDAGKAAAKVSAAAAELVEAVDSVSAVIEENTSATEEMAANSSELTQAIENIASVSEENSAAVEQVSASTEEVSAQVEEVSTSAASLMEMAQKLQQVVARFKLQ
jgi:methyl-accepting chemotaxis protein